MARAKNKTKISKTSAQDVKLKKVLNPFEIHVNREKAKILGRKVKNDRGVPGLSRSRALKKRKHTLLREYDGHNKSNKFVDKRIGEYNRSISEQDRSLARYSALKKKAHKQSIFNLADEVLTHRGQTLNEIENFEDPCSDDQESLDENQSGRLDSDFVEEAHFGGGLLQRTGVDGAKSHKDLIDQLISESKKRKAEKQKLKEQTLELTEKLDTEWKDLLPLVNKNTKSDASAIEEKKISDYDKAVQELRFEARGVPSDRLKTEDEIVKEEKEKLDKLEQKRLERMRGLIYEKSLHKNHRSADDLDDNFAYEADSEIVLSYNKEGESNLKVEAEMIDETAQNGSTSGESENSEDSGTESEEDDLSDLRNDSCTSEGEADADTEFAEERNGEECVEETTSEDVNKSSCVKESPFNEEESLKNSPKQIRIDLLKRKELMDQARKELPYTFNLPESYESFHDLFKSRPPAEQGIILERMIKCNHPSLAENNKQHLSMLFVYLLQYVNDLPLNQEVRKSFEIFSFLVPYLFDLAAFDKEAAHKAVLEVIKEKQMEFRKNTRKYPAVNILLFLKLVSCLFPTSDFRHQVVTPSVVFIDQMLNSCKIRSRKDIAYGLFLVTLVLEYTSFSKRYLPSAINFLTGVLHMAVPKTGVQLIKVMAPFKSSCSALVLEKNFSKNDVDSKLDVCDLMDVNINEEFKVQIFYVVLFLLNELLDQFRELPSNCELFNNPRKYLNMIDISKYPTKVQDKYCSLKNQIEELQNNRNLMYIVPEKKRPKALRLYEPNIQKVFDGKRHKIQSKEKMERAKLLQKLKKERKGALREIRLDTAFLGRIKIAGQIQNDLERKQKVKRLYAEASLQQGELNAMKRKNKQR